jgi:hypothetical protein
MASAAVALLLLTGCASSGNDTHAVNAVSPVAAPPSEAAIPTSVAPASPKATTASDVMPASVPVSIEFPSWRKQAKLISLGLRSDGTLEVPPGEPGAPAAWFNGSPTPGERGPSVVYGHVNATDGGSGVFANLRNLKKGDFVRVTRKDGSTAIFTFDHGEQYAKSAFPTEKVYGNTDGAELRLITCDGYDPKTGEFDDNYVVYAKLAI